MRYAHLAPDHLRAEIARTERVVEPVVGTKATTGDESAGQVLDFQRHSPVAQSVERVTVNGGPAHRRPSRLSAHFRASARCASLFSHLSCTT